MIFSSCSGVSKPLFNWASVSQPSRICPGLDNPFGIRERYMNELEDNPPQEWGTGDDKIITDGE